jgi:hypothetical protein
MRKAIIASTAVFTIAAVAWATDVWKKPYEQWDKKDVLKVLDDSPWAKTVRITATWESSGNAYQPMPGGQTQPQPQTSGQQGGGAHPGMGGGGAQPAAPPSGGMEPGMQGTPTAVFVVRWVSSLTVREALVRSAVLNGELNESQAKTDLSQPPDVYQIMVAGPQMLPFEQSTEDGVKNASYLEVKKSKQRIQPVKVEFQRSPEGQKVTAVIISFPKTANGQPTIGPDAKGADFSVSLARASIHTSFDFSKMDDAQGRDL